MKDLLIFMIQSLVDNKEKISIKEIEGEHSLVFQITVADEDKGKIIGKQGKTANAIRTIVKSIALKENKRVVIEII